MTKEVVHKYGWGHLHELNDLFKRLHFQNCHIYQTAMKMMLFKAIKTLFPSRIQSEAQI